VRRAPRHARFLATDGPVQRRAATLPLADDRGIEPTPCHPRNHAIQRRWRRELGPALARCLHQDPSDAMSRAGARLLGAGVVAWLLLVLAHGDLTWLVAAAAALVAAVACARGIEMMRRAPARMETVDSRTIAALDRRLLSMAGDLTPRQRALLRAIKASIVELAGQARDARTGTVVERRDAGFVRACLLHHLPELIDIRMQLHDTVRDRTTGQHASTPARWFDRRLVALLRELRSRSERMAIASAAALHHGWRWSPSEGAVDTADDGARDAMPGAPP
jgi:hypothetical protein